jgi:hypothetical protein
MANEAGLGCSFQTLAPEADAYVVVAEITGRDAFALLILPRRPRVALAGGVSYPTAWEGEAGTLRLTMERFGVSALRTALTSATDPQGLAPKLVGGPSTLTVSEPSGAVLFHLSLPTVDPITDATHVMCLRRERQFPPGFTLGPVVMRRGTPGGSRP